jgi:hypothetical protein
MFHRRCRETEDILRSELEEARERIRHLEAELDSKLQVAPAPSAAKGSVIYMDDKRMVQAETRPR